MVILFPALIMIVFKYQLTNVNYYGELHELNRVEFWRVKLFQEVVL